MSAPSPSAITGQVLPSATLATASALGASAGALAAAGPVFGAVAAIPRLFSLIFPSDPASGFRGPAALPPGTPIGVPGGLLPESAQQFAGPSLTFGLPGPSEALDSPLPRGFFPGVGLTGRVGVGSGIFAEFGRALRVSPIASAQLALSFDPAVAATGEARLQEFVNLPVPPISPRATSGVIGKIFQQILPAAFDPVLRQEAATASAEARIPGIRSTAAEAALANPFFQSAAAGFSAGVLGPTAELSTAAAAAFGVVPEPSVALGAFSTVSPDRAVTGRDPTIPTVSQRTNLSTGVEGGIPGGFFQQAQGPTRIQGGSLVPNVSTSLPVLSGPLGGQTSSFGGFLGGLADVISAAAPIALPFINRAIGPAPQPVALPGGAPTGVVGRGFAQPASAFGDIFGGLLGGGLLEQGAQSMAGFFSGGGGAGCIVPTQRTTLRLPARVDVPKMDAGGNMTFVTYKNMGRPLLYQGDLAATKRVRKVAARARRAGGR